MVFNLPVCKCDRACFVPLGGKKEGIQMITVKGLTKEFSGFQALKGLNMHVKAGEVYGFIPGFSSALKLALLCQFYMAGYCRGFMCYFYYPA
jgi:hypothetical protein